MEKIVIKQLDMRNRCVLEDIVELQKKSYKIEADLIGFDNIPPLHDTVDSISESEETFCGTYIDGNLIAIVSYIVEDGVFDIYRMAVHPNFFRRGIGDKLLSYILKIGADEFVDKFVVSTGMKNEPAKKLYLKHGFKFIGDKEVAGGLKISTFEKKVGNIEGGVYNG